MAFGNIDVININELMENILIWEAEEEIVVGHVLLQMFLNPIVGGIRAHPGREIMNVDINFWRDMGDPTFHSHFRMTRRVFQELIVALGHHLQERNRIHFLRTPLDVTIMMALWILATPDTFRSAGNQFGVTKGVIFYHYVCITLALREMSEKYIRWPSPLERELIKASFEDRYGYPGVVGCIDCCHIKIIAPHLHPHRYLNRHDDKSLVIQALCDHRMLYRDVYVGEPGTVGDLRTFQRSPLCNQLFNREGYLSEGDHILGDGAYPLSKQIMIPFTNDGHLSNRQRAHNLQLSRARATIERSFALLRGKMRRLKSLPSRNLVIAVNHMMASLVIHNFIELQGELPGLAGENFQLDNNDIDVQANLHNIVLAARGEGAVKRELMAEMLYPIAD